MYSTPVAFIMRLLIGLATATNYAGAVFRLFSTLALVVLVFSFWGNLLGGDTRINDELPRRVSYLFFGVDHIVATISAFVLSPQTVKGEYNDAYSWMIMWNMSILSVGIFVMKIPPVAVTSGMDSVA